jgi:hypothetical protein
MVFGFLNDRDCDWIIRFFFASPDSELKGPKFFRHVPPGIRHPEQLTYWNPAGLDSSACPGPDPGFAGMTACNLHI